MSHIHFFTYTNFNWFSTPRCFITRFGASKIRFINIPKNDQFLQNGHSHELFVKCTKFLSALCGVSIFGLFDTFIGKVPTLSLSLDRLK